MERFRRAWSTPSRLEAGLSLVAAGALLAVILVSADADRRGGLVALGLVALVVLAVPGIAAGSPLAVGLAVIALGLGGLAAGVPASPLFAVGLFATAELALWSAEDRLLVTEDPGPRRERTLLVAGVASASVAVGAVLVLLARRRGEGDSLSTLVAAAAVVGLAALIVGVASSRRAGGSQG